ncbi:MAG: hypothetical protein ACO20I_13085 [bacterium]
MTRFAGADLGLIPEEIAAIGASKEFPIEALLNEGEEIAGLRGLPVTRMLRQPARKQQKLWNSPSKYGNGLIPPKDVNRILRRTQETKEAIDNWDPIEAEWKERSNRENPNPRSKTVRNTFKQDINFKFDTETELMNMAAKGLRGSGESVYDPGNNRLIKYLDLLPPAQAAEYRRLKYEQFDRTAKMWQDARKDFDPYQMNADLTSGRDRDLDNDLLAEWKTERRLKTLDDLDTFGGLIRTIDTPSQEGKSLNEIMFPGI